VKPRPSGAGIEKMVAQARAQARTAVRLVRRHPTWRAFLATGINPVQLRFHAAMRRTNLERRLRKQLEGAAPDRPLERRQLRAARALANEVYFAELERALQADRA
jgi:hypothetical protein